MTTIKHPASANTATVPKTQFTFQTSLQYFGTKFHILSKNTSPLFCSSFLNSAHVYSGFLTVFWAHSFRRFLLFLSTLHYLNPSSNTSTFLILPCPSVVILFTALLCLLKNTKTRCPHCPCHLDYSHHVESEPATFEISNLGEDLASIKLPLLP